jgi:hypothetical protein
MTYINPTQKQPEIIAPKVEKKIYELPPPGLTPATLKEIRDLGMVTFGDKTNHKVLMGWLLDTKDSKGQDMMVFERANLSVHHLSKLAARIEAITGLLPAEDKPYKVHTLLEGRALLQIRIGTTEKGTYPNVFAAFPIGSMIPTAAATAPPTAAAPTKETTTKPVATGELKAREPVAEPPESEAFDPSEYDEATSFPTGDAASKKRVA